MAKTLYSEKTLQPGERRFIAKQWTDSKVWGVYDRVTASWPASRPGVGLVDQQHKSWSEAELEAIRVESIVGSSPL